VSALVTTGRVGVAAMLAGALACKSAPAPAAAPGPAPASAPLAAEQSRLLPGMLGTFVPEGANEEGRVLIVSEGLIAAIACADCGVPTYFRLDAVTCTDGPRCEVSGVGCAGTLTLLEDRTLEVRTRAQDDVAAACDVYAGRFVPGETVGTRGAVVPTGQAPRGQVVVTDIRSPRDVDLDAARAVVDAGIDALDACYQHALERAPSLAGTLVVEVVHGARDKHATPAKIRDPELDAPHMVACIEQAFGGWRFPAPTDGLPGPVYYTLAFVLR
jgi:hypothetical protein